MQDPQIAGHLGLVHVRAEDRTARIRRIRHNSRIDRMDLDTAHDIAIGVGISREIGLDRDAYP